MFALWQRLLDWLRRWVGWVPGEPGGYFLRPWRGGRCFPGPWAALHCPRPTSPTPALPAASSSTRRWNCR